MVLLRLLVCEVREGNCQVVSAIGVGKVADLLSTVLLTLMRVYPGEVFVNPAHTFSGSEHPMGNSLISEQRWFNRGWGILLPINLGREVHVREWIDSIFGALTDSSTRVISSW